MHFRTRMKVSDEIPTSSMGDIAFLLIVFFMVTTVFAARKGIFTVLPKPDSNPEPQTSSELRAVYIRINPDDTLLVDQQVRDLNELNAYARMKIAENPEKFFIVHPTDTAKFGRVIDVIDELQQCKVKNMTLPTKEEVRSWGNQDFLN